MLKHLIAKFTIWLLKNNKITGEDKTLVIASLLDNIDALPIHEVIKFSENGIVINGNQIEPDVAIKLRESAVALRDSYARKTIHNQMTYEAIKMGVHTGLNPEMIMFSKAALWYQQQEDKIIASLTDV